MFKKCKIKLKSKLQSRAKVGNKVDYTKTDIMTPHNHHYNTQPTNTTRLYPTNILS